MAGRCPFSRCLRRNQGGASGWSFGSLAGRISGSGESGFCRNLRSHGGFGRQCFLRWLPVPLWLFLCCQIVQRGRSRQSCLPEAWRGQGWKSGRQPCPFVAAAGHWTGKICAILFWWSIRLRGSRNQDRQLPDRRQPGGGCQIARRIQELYKEKDRQQPVRCRQLPVPDRLLARQETGRIARKRIAAFSCRG